MTNICSVSYTVNAAEERRLGLETQNKDLQSADAVSDNNIDERQALVAREIIRGGRCLEEILTEYSVGDDEFTKWVLDGHFAKYAENLARAFAEINAPRVWAALVDEATSGKVPAIKLYLDLWAKNHRAADGEDTATLVMPPAEIEVLRDELFGGEL
jgi:hypothetical protein